MSSFQCCIFLKGWIRRIENGKYQLLKIDRSLYIVCYFIKIIKEPGTSFQSPVLSQKHARNVCYKIH